MTRDPRNLSELSLHKAVVQHLKLRAAPGVVWFHPPNGEVRSPRTAAKLKAMGVRPGVSDLVIMVPGNLRCCFMEFKSLSGRASPAQSLFRREVEKLLCEYAMVHSINEALMVLEAWGAIA